MTQNEAYRMVQLLEAQSSGKQIQARLFAGEPYENIELLPKLCYKNIDSIGMSYQNIEDIRIKPEIKYVPYDLKDLTYFMIQEVEFLNEIGKAFTISAVYKSGTLRVAYKDGDQSQVIDADIMVKSMTLDGHPAGNPVEIEDE